MLAAPTEQFEEWTNDLPTVAMADSQHAGVLGIHEDGGITVTLVQEELVHH